MSDTRPTSRSGLDWIALVIRDICEIPYRFSPEDFPEAMVVTPEELRRYIEEHAPRSENSAQLAPPTEAEIAWYRDISKVLLPEAPKELHGAIEGIRVVAEQGRDGMDRLFNAPRSATSPIKTIPLIKRLREQRDRCADALRPFVHAGGPHDWKLALEQANKVLAEVPSYEQQLRNVAEGIGMTYEELIEAMKARAEGGNHG